MTVQRLLDGNREDIVQLPFTLGMLLISGGRQTIHWVPQVHGNTPRLVPVLCYAEQLGLANSETCAQTLLGSSLKHVVPHLNAEDLVGRLG